MTWQTDADTALLTTLLGTFDHAPVWRQAQAPHTTQTVVGHKRNFGASETELVGAYGIDGCEIICKAASFPTPPTKFDRFTIDGEVFTVTDVKPQRGFNNSVILYRCFSRGK